MASSTSSQKLSQKIELQQFDPQALKAWIKAQALDLGFSDCVIAKPDAQDQMPRFKEYLKRGYHADMHYLEENLEKRADPTLLVPGTKSIICVRMNYLVASPKPRYVPFEPKPGLPVYCKECLFKIKKKLKMSSGSLPNINFFSSNE